MAIKVVLFAALLTVARAGILGYSAAPTLSYAAPAVAKVAYSSAPAVSYSSVSSPVAAYSAAPVYSKVAAPTLSYAAPAYKVAAPLAYAAPVAKEVYADAPANYDFGYSVNDPHTGDSKSQQETRHGDAVHGSYSLIEADGSKRIVEYTADAHNGFNAVVHKEAAAVAVKTAVPVVTKAYATPYASPYAAPYAAPVTKYAAAPAVSYSSVSSPVAVGPAYAKVAAPAYYH